MNAMTTVFTDFCSERTAFINPSDCVKSLRIFILPTALCPFTRLNIIIFLLEFSFPESALLPVPPDLKKLLR